MIYLQTSEIPERRTNDDRPRSGDFIAIPITARQLECLDWADQGKTAFEIGVILGMSTRTVEGHHANACRRLGVNKTIHAVSLARERGWLPLGNRKIAGPGG